MACLSSGSYQKHVHWKPQQLWPAVCRVCATSQQQMAAATTALSDRQLEKWGLLWAQWHATHDSATAALSSAVNIHGRLQDLSDPAALPVQQQQQQESEQAQQDVQQLVVSKQLASLDRALSLLRGHHDQLQQVVRDMERLYVDASRCLSLSGRALAGAVVPKGPEPSLVQVVEAMQDTWTMCRDELLLKLAILGLVALDASPTHMATLLQCYREQPNIERARPDAVLGMLQETRQRREQRR